MSEWSKYEPQYNYPTGWYKIMWLAILGYVVCYRAAGYWFDDNMTMIVEPDVEFDEAWMMPLPQPPKEEV